jgi:hypothetical protein
VAGENASGSCREERWSLCVLWQCAPGDRRQTWRPILLNPVRARLASPSRKLRFDLGLTEVPNENPEEPAFPALHEEVHVYLVRDGWRWKRVSADGSQVLTSDRAFDFRTEAFSDARRSNPGLEVRKTAPPPFE